MIGSISFTVSEDSDKLTSIQVHTDLDHVSMEDKLLMVINTAQVMNLSSLERMMAASLLMRGTDSSFVESVKVLPEVDGTFDPEKLRAAQDLLLNMRGEEA